MTSKYTYAEIESYLPMMVRTELEKADDTQRRIFADDFGQKKKSKLAAYLFLCFLCAHRWYLGKPGMTVLQWVLNLCGGIGLIWVVIDLFLIPGMVRTRNAEIAKNLLVEQRIIGGYNSSSNAPIGQPMVVNVSNK